MNNCPFLFLNSTGNMESKHSIFLQGSECGLWRLSALDSNPRISIHLLHDILQLLTFLCLGFLIDTMEVPTATSQNEFKVQPKVCRAWDSHAFPPKSPVLAGVVVSSAGSTGRGYPSKPTPWAAGGIQFHTCWLTEGCQQAAGWRPPQFLLCGPLHGAAHNMAGGFPQCKQMRGGAR